MYENNKNIGWKKKNNGGENVDLSDYATKDELNNKADIDDVPTKISELQNDSNFISSIPEEYITETELNAKGYLTEHQNISGKADKSYVNTELAKKSDKTHTHDQYLTEHQDISGKANKSEIPTKTSQLTNDSGFITKVPSEYITETELNSKGLATETFVTNKIADSLILTSPNGSKFTITVSDDGQLSATPYGTNE